MTDTENPPTDESESQVPEEYRMEGDRRPEKVRRRNLITGLIFLVIIATIVGISVWTRATAATIP